MQNWRGLAHQGALGFSGWNVALCARPWAPLWLWDPTSSHHLGWRGCGKALLTQLFMFIQEMGWKEPSQAHADTWRAGCSYKQSGHQEGPPSPAQAAEREQEAGDTALCCALL